MPERWNVEADSDISCSLYAWNSHQRVGKETEGIGDQRKNQDHIDQTREARILRRDLKRLLVTQTPVRDHQLKLVWIKRGEIITRYNRLTQKLNTMDEKKGNYPDPEGPQKRNHSKSLQANNACQVCGRS